MNLILPTGTVTLRLIRGYTSAIATLHTGVKWNLPLVRITEQPPLRELELFDEMPKVSW